MRRMAVARHQPGKQRLAAMRQAQALGAGKLRRRADDVIAIHKDRLWPCDPHICRSLSICSYKRLDALEAAQGGIDSDTQTLDDAASADGHCLKAGRAIGIEVLFENWDGQNIGEVAFVPLQYQGEIAGVLAHLAQFFAKLGEALDVFLQLAGLGIGDEHHAIGSLQYRDARLLIEYLAGHGIQLEANLEAMHAP